MHKRYQNETLNAYLKRVEFEISESAKGRRALWASYPQAKAKRTKNKVLVTRQKFSIWTVIDLIISHNSRCHWCCTYLKDKPYHLDHYYPLSRDGSDTPDNLRLSCVDCNLAKGATLPMDFALRLLGASRKAP